VNNACPSLYYATGEERYPGGSLIASEPLTDSSAWQPVPEHHLLTIEADGTHRLQPL
jgi:predicted glutamine amidotransferase